MAALRLPLLFMLALCLLAPNARAEADSRAGELGIVLMHGKEGRPAAPVMTRLAGALRNAGYLVSTPEMPWSRARIYDAGVDETMLEIDKEVDALRQRGARRIVVAGHSMGANAAIRYAATRTVDGAVLLAPGHSPGQFRKLTRDVQRARQLVAEGNDERAEFGDINVGREFIVMTRPTVYLSWFDPAGAAVMPKNAAAIKVPVPLFIATGTRDPVAAPQDYIFDKAPAHLKSKFLSVSADHIGVPDAATDALLAWLATL